MKAFYSVHDLNIIKFLIIQSSKQQKQIYIPVLENDDMFKCFIKQYQKQKTKASLGIKVHGVFKLKLTRILLIFHSPQSHKNCMK